MEYFKINHFHIKYNSQKGYFGGIKNCQEKRSTLVFILFFSLPISLLFFSFFNFSFTEKVDFDNKEIDNRFCYDATYSHLNLEIFLSEKKIKGFNKMVFHSRCDISQIVIDLT